MIKKKITNQPERVVVVNKYHSNYDFYIGRGSVLGNPYPITNTDSRDSVCDKYEVWFEQNKDRPDVKEYLNKILAKARLGSVSLGCFCKPQRCHGDTIKQWLDQQLGVSVMKSLEVLKMKTNKPNPNYTYCGIGSRKTPVAVMKVMTEIAQLLEKSGYRLYSGAAEGADKAFSDGCINKIEFIPWKGFNGCNTGIIAVSNEAMLLASVLHPAWNKLSEGARKLMTRNCHQILGKDLDSPVDFVLCWTPDGAEDRTTINTGGTGQAIRLANKWGIPVINIANNSWKQRLEMIMKDLNDNKTKDMFEEEPLTKEELMKKREQELLKVPAYNRNNTTFQDLMKG